MACAVALAGTYGLALPSVTANDSLLAQPRLRLPGESGSASVAIDLPPFLEPLARHAPVQDAVPQTRPPSALQPSLTGDSWNRTSASPSRSNPRLPTDAEQDASELDWLRRGFVRMTVVLLVCAAVAAFAVLFTVANRR